MKAVLIFALTFVVLQIDANPLLRFKRGATDKDTTSCIRDLNLDEEEIYEILKRDYSPEDNQNHAKFQKCFWLKKGYLKDDNSINYDALRQMIIDIFEKDLSSDLSRKIADETLSTCRQIDADSASLKVIKVGNCILRNLKELKNSH